MQSPNVVYVFGDQWRAQSTGYGGNSEVRTPNIDRLRQESVEFNQAVSGCPVCSPYRGSLLTGQRPLTHGVFVNDVCLQPNGIPLGEAFKQSGYDTAYIGKWHLDGHGRSNYIPPERRCGFETWKVLECTHDYNHSHYYEGDSEEKRTWQGYDAIAQTQAAQDYIRQHPGNQPFLLVLSWGPPHNPYETAPEAFKALYEPEQLSLRPNVPEAWQERTRKWLAGYYAHCSVLDWCIGELLQTLDECNLAENTIFVFTSDHGDMLGSHGEWDKQRPYDESVRVPFLLRHPARLERKAITLEAPIDAPDIMPTLLGLCSLPIPNSVEGLDYSGYIHGGANPSDGAALLICPHPFGNWTVKKHGGREYRGLRTAQYTYVRSLEGPWLLFDNQNDPYQQTNLVDDSAYLSTRNDLDAWLQEKLDTNRDEFLAGMEYVHRWNYQVDENGTVPFVW